MSFLDTLKDRLGFDGGDGRDRYYDDGYEDDPYEDRYDERYRPVEDRYVDADRYDDRQEDYDDRPSSGMLGNTPRPNAESVSVYTRSGKLVDTNGAYEDPATPATYAHEERTATAPSAGAYHPSPELAAKLGVTRDPSYSGSALDYGHITPGDVGLTPIPRASGKLPAYVLKPQDYEDVQVMVSRVRTNQPVVLDFANTKIDLAKRILDYSFGFAAGVEGTVRELGDRCFVVLPHAIELTASEIDKLEHEGVIRR